MINFIKAVWLWLITPVKPEKMDEEEYWFRAIK